MYGRSLVKYKSKYRQFNVYVMAFSECTYYTWFCFYPRILWYFVTYNTYIFLLIVSLLQYYLDPKLFFINQT